MKTISENLYLNNKNSQINNDIHFIEQFVNNMSSEDKLSSESIIEEFTNSEEEFNNSEEEFTDSEEEFTDSEEEFTDSEYSEFEEFTENGDLIECFKKRKKKMKKRKPKKRKPKKKKKKKKKKPKKKKPKKKKTKKKKTKKKKPKKQRAKELAGKAGVVAAGVGGAVALGVGMMVVPELLKKDEPITPDSMLDTTGSTISDAKGNLDKVGKSSSASADSAASAAAAAAAVKKSTESKIGKDEILKNGKIIKKKPTQVDFDKIIKDEIKKIEKKKKLDKSSLSDKENMLLSNSFDRITKHLEKPLIIIGIVLLLHIILPIILHLFSSSGEANEANETNETNETNEANEANEANKANEANEA